jgi:hypothetical protein
VYCIFLFLYAASLFGTLISQVTEIVASHAAMSKELDSILEAYLAVHPRQGFVISHSIFGFVRILKDFSNIFTIIWYGAV